MSSSNCYMCAGYLRVRSRTFLVSVAGFRLCKSPKACILLHITLMLHLANMLTNFFSKMLVLTALSAFILSSATLASPAPNQEEPTLENGGLVSLMAVYHGPLLSNQTYNGTSGRVRTVIVPATQVLPVSTGHDPVHHQGPEAVSAGIREDSRGKFVYQKVSETVCL